MNSLMPVQEGDLVELKVEKLTPNGGRGLARYKGMVIFIPFTVPGDLVRIKVTKLKKSFAEAEVIKIIEPSKDRIKAKCQYFGECGGCTLQMVTIDYQKKLKQSFIKEMLLRLKIDPKGLLGEVVSSPKEFRYRNRIQLHQKGFELGYYKKDTHNLIPIDDCLIADERLIEKFSDLRQKKETRRFEIALTQGGRVFVRDKKSKNPKELLFSQINQGVNLKIIDYLQETLNALEIKRNNALDLYAGSGNFSRVLLNFFKNVIAVELSRPSVEKAKKNLKEVDFICMPVENFFEKNNKNFDFIVLDPPRQGLNKEVSNKLVASGTEYILYISCNPATLERDLKVLLSAYKVCKVKLFDMFPQTSHLEVCVILKKQSV